ncbi:MAG: response regulator, partial [Gemmatimonadota bacterium]|nr:response regulator [Gemmatimonadota bacterium]
MTAVAAPAAAGARILVVDDTEANRDLLSRRLEKQGHTVAAVGGGAAALERLRTEPFDLVLLDIMMPDMNGYEVLERLKSDRDLRHLPVIMITAITEMDSVVRCIELGAEDHLAKPFNATLLRARIDASLAR